MKINCVFTSKERPHCWKHRGKVGFCSFLSNLNAPSPQYKEAPFFSCNLENNRNLEIEVTKSGNCKYYTRGANNVSKLLKKLHNQALVK